tara:strand:+ start:37 stop:420 length:384 start_codon:yes stop_codon:yes gene_type:complete
MAFKLGKTSSRKPIAQSGSLKSTPVYKKKLEEGVKGEAYADGTIAISIDIKPGSAKYKEVLTHEKDHSDRIKNKELTYGENYVKWRGSFYNRKDGNIEYKGKSYMEGHPDLPWEALAFKASNKVKNS